MKLLPANISDSSKTKPLVLVVVVAALAVVAGATGLVFSSPYSPLLLLGGAVIAVIFFAWVAKPVWALYAALFVIFLPAGMIPDNIQSLLNRSLTIIAAGLWLARLLFARKKMVWTAPAIFMLCFLVWGGVTLFWVDNMGPATSTLQVYLLRLLLFLLLIPNEINTRQGLDGLMRTLALSAWLLVLSFAWTVLRQGYTAGSRLSIFGGNENAAAVMALIGLLGVMWQASQPSKNHRLLLTFTTAIYILLMIGLIAMSGSRGGALSLILTLCILFIWKPLRSWGKFVFLIAVLLLIFNASMFTTLAKRFAVEGRDTFLGGRESLWQAAWRVIQDHPLGGVGIGNSSYAVVSFLETEARLSGAQTASVHNPILTIASETGILGLIFYVGVLVTALYSFGKQYLRFRNHGPSNLQLYFALVSSITVGYTLSWIKGGGMQSAYSYFLILALLVLPSTLDVASFEINLPTAQKTGAGAGEPDMPRSQERGLHPL